MGSSASAYALAAMSESMNWNYIFLVISGIAALSGIVCVLVRNYKVKA
jgi:sugar phosphate permease